MRAALRAGREFAVFVEEGDPQTTFDPTQHAAVILYDVAAARPGDLEGGSAAPRLMMTFARAYEHLRIPTEIRLCAGLRVPGPARKEVFVLFDFLVKAMEEDWSALTSRVARVLPIRLDQPGVLSCFEPLSFARVASAFRAHARGRGEDWCRRLHPMLLAPNDLRSVGKVQHAVSRIQASLVRSVDELHERVGDVHSAFLWLPKALVRRIPRATRLGRVVYRGNAE